MRPSDVHSLDPVGAFLLQEVDGTGAQEYLWTDVGPGDPVTLELLRATSSAMPRVFYKVLHNRIPIGITTESFGGVLFRTLRLHGRWRVRWPSRIEDLFVESIDTALGSPAAGQRVGLGRSGLWLRVRLAGLGRLVFD